VAGFLHCSTISRTRSIEFIEFVVERPTGSSAVPARDLVNRAEVRVIPGQGHVGRGLLIDRNGP
jgi:hypothetical protein